MPYLALPIGLDLATTQALLPNGTRVVVRTSDHPKGREGSVVGVVREGPGAFAWVAIWVALPGGYLVSGTAQSVDKWDTSGDRPKPVLARIERTLTDYVNHESVDMSVMAELLVDTREELSKAVEPLLVFHLQKDDDADITSYHKTLDGAQARAVELRNYMREDDPAALFWDDTLADQGIWEAYLSEAMDDDAAWTVTRVMVEG